MDKTKNLENSENLRKNIYLPIIKNPEEIQDYARQLAELIISLFDPDNEYNKYKEQETEMLYHALVLLISCPTPKQLKLAIHCYLSPDFVHHNIQFLASKDTYEYWQSKVPEFMKQQDDIANLLRHFYINLALVIGEDIVQNFCSDYKRTTII